MEWILFSILAAFCWAIVNIVDKFLLTKWIKKPIVPLMILGAVGLIASIVIFSIQGFSNLSFINIVLALMAGVFYCIMAFLYFKAVKMEEISRVIPLLYLSPLLILIFASIFLGELFEPIKYLGIILLVIGAILISTYSLTKITLGKAFWLILLANLFIAFNQVITKYLLGFTDFWTIFSWVRIGVFISLIPAYFLYFADIKSTIKEHGKKVIAIVSLNESLNVTGIILFTFALSMGYVTLANALSSIQPLFVLIFALILSVFYPKFLKEGIGKFTIVQKTIAIILMITGAMLIS